MLARVIEALIYVLALYGLVNIVEAVLNYFSQSSHFRKQKYELVLTVKNQQDNIEGVIRTIFEDELFRRSGPECKVVVIDKGSEDETVKILERLAREYENLEVIVDDGDEE